jgi:plastocyanin
MASSSLIQVIFQVQLHLQMKYTLTSFLLFGASLAQAANHVVTVDDSSVTKFIPNKLLADIGDTIEFQFLGDVRRFITVC